MEEIDKCMCGKPIVDVQTDQCQECIVAEYAAMDIERQKNERCSKYRYYKCCADCTDDSCPLDNPEVAVRILEDTEEVIPF